MLFRNLRFYEYTGKHRPRTARLVEQLAAGAFEPCRPQQPESVGWVVPDGSEDGNLVIELGERQLCCLMVEQRTVPAAVVRERHVAIAVEKELFRFLVPLRVRCLRLWFQTVPHRKVGDAAHDASSKA
jgi:recombination associated protein RdgC